MTLTKAYPPAFGDAVVAVYKSHSEEMKKQAEDLALHSATSKVDLGAMFTMISSMGKGNAKESQGPCVALMVVDGLPPYNNLFLCGFARCLNVVTAATLLLHETQTNQCSLRLTLTCGRHPRRHAH
jgi:hypothetical protein